VVLLVLLVVRPYTSSYHQEPLQFLRQVIYHQLTTLWSLVVEVVLVVTQVVGVLVVIELLRQKDLVDHPHLQNLHLQFLQTRLIQLLLEVVVVRAMMPLELGQEVVLLQSLDQTSQLLPVKVVAVVLMMATQ
jgi:hypothetical protein